MSFLGKLKDLVGVDDDEFGEGDYLDDEPIQPTPRPSGSSGLGDWNTTFGNREKEPYREPWRSSFKSPDPVPIQQGSRSMQARLNENVLKNSSANTLRALTQKFKIVVVEPKLFEDSTKLVDNLKTRKPVIINLEKVERDTARKIFDFLSGATYALSGNVQKITNNIFVFLPENVDVTTSPDHDGMTFGAPSGNPWQR
ncbi:MAG: cell division protein SepF [Clostridiales Family XIII bacterium]|jgi:FtsZ-interacting cell division protein YlmF|nr:cell division protein SepF [Clostridiales Family XIII bacterium]